MGHRIAILASLFVHTAFAAEPNVGKLSRFLYFTNGGISVSNEGKVVLDSEQWKTQVKKTGTLYEDKHVAGNRAVFAEGDGEKLSGLSYSYDEAIGFLGDEDEAWRAEVHNGQIVSITSCSKTAGCWTVNPAFCRAFLEKTGQKSFEAVADALDSCSLSTIGALSISGLDIENLLVQEAKNKAILGTELGLDYIDTKKRPFLHAGNEAQTKAMLDFHFNQRPILDAVTKAADMCGAILPASEGGGPERLRGDAKKAAESKTHAK